MIHTHQFSATTRPLGLLFAVASLLSLVLPHPGQLSAGTITFSLGSPTFSGSIAEFDLQLEFTGDPGDQIDAIQFGVNALDPGLPTDFSRFSFALDNNSPFDSWLSSGTLGFSGAELLAPFFPSVGPLVTPGTRQLGVLSVDVAGLPAGSPINVSLSNPFFPTDVGGTFGGESVDSLVNASPADVTLALAEPQGVTFNNPIPEPNSLLAFVGLAAMMAGRKRRRPMPHRSE